MHYPHHSRYRRSQRHEEPERSEHSSSYSISLHQPAPALIPPYQSNALALTTSPNPSISTYHELAEYQIASRGSRYHDSEFERTPRRRDTGHSLNSEPPSSLESNDYRTERDEGSYDRSRYHHSPVRRSVGSFEFHNNEFHGEEDGYEDEYRVTSSRSPSPYPMQYQSQHSFSNGDHVLMHYQQSTASSVPRQNEHPGDIVYGRSRAESYSSSQRTIEGGIYGRSSGSTVMTSGYAGSSLYPTPDAARYESPDVGHGGRRESRHRRDSRERRRYGQEQEEDTRYLSTHRDDHRRPGESRSRSSLREIGEIFHVGRSRYRQ